MIHDSLYDWILWVFVYLDINLFAKSLSKVVLPPKLLLGTAVNGSEAK